MPDEAPFSRGRWIRTGLAAWTAVALVWMVDVGLQLMRTGMPVWWAVPNTLVAIAPGVLLTPVVFLAFHRFLDASLRLSSRAGLYAAIGVGFWITWSVLVFALHQTGMVFGVQPDVGMGTALFRNVAGFSFNSLILYSVMVTLHEALLHVREARWQELRRERLQTELTRARTATLQAQLNPHFLFNTLHVAAGLTGTDRDAARRVLGDLTELLRASLAEGREQLVPLRDEVRLLERYAGIQKARFQDRLQVEFQIDPDTLGLGIPPLLLQPLVENAVVHGVAPSEAGGRIRISSARDNGHLRVVVRDTGRGFTGRADRPRQERVGIAGTRARLDVQFGDDASLRYSYPPDGGFQAEVVLPALGIPT